MGRVPIASRALAGQADACVQLRRYQATAGRNAKIDWKALSKRIGHADVAFTMEQYVQTDLEADREVANTLAHLILGGLLITDEIIDQSDETKPDGSIRDGAENARAQG